MAGLFFYNYTQLDHRYVGTRRAALLEEEKPAHLCDTTLHSASLHEFTLTNWGLFTKSIRSEQRRWTSTKQYTKKNVIISANIFD